MAQEMHAPKSLIINSPYERPQQHWEQARDGTLTLVPSRRPAGYEIFDVRSSTAPFSCPSRRARIGIAVKIVDDCGIESLKIIPLD